MRSSKFIVSELQGGVVFSRSSHLKIYHSKWSEENGHKGVLYVEWPRSSTSVFKTYCMYVVLFLYVELWSNWSLQEEPHLKLYLLTRQLLINPHFFFSLLVMHYHPPHLTFSSTVPMQESLVVVWIFNIKQKPHRTPKITPCHQVEGVVYTHVIHEFVWWGANYKGAWIM